MKHQCAQVARLPSHDWVSDVSPLLLHGRAEDGILKE